MLPVLLCGIAHQQLRGQELWGQENSHGTVLLMHEKFPCKAVQQIFVNVTLQTVLSEQLPLLFLVLFSKTAGAETSPAP